MATKSVRNKNKGSEGGPRDPARTLKKLHEALEDYDNCIGVTADRLYDAYLSIHLLTPSDFPEPMQPRFIELMRAMTWRLDPTPEGKSGRIGDARNTLKGMDPIDCQRILYLLTDLILEVERSMEPERQGRTSHSQQQPSAA